jgi:hypothetical protein
VIEKRVKFVIVNHLKTISSVRSPCGSISNNDSHTPVAHHVLMSSDERLFTTRTISGMFQNGSIMPATSDTIPKIVIVHLFCISASMPGSMFLNKALDWHAPETLSA